MSEFARLSVESATASDEASLLSRARNGDRDATELLVRRYLRDVYDFTTRVLNDRDLAQDATQDTFVNALGALHRFRGEASFRTWLLRIALNSARSVGRRRSRKREIVLEAAAEIPVESMDETERISNRALAKKIEDLLPRLPEKQRLAVVLRLQQGLSYQEVSIALDCSEGSARVNYHLGIKRLREWLT